MPLFNARFEPQQKLAQGSDTLIYRGYDHESQAPVLIKAFDLNAIHSWKRFELIQREEDLLAQMHHPRIPGFVSSFSEGPPNARVLYLVSHWIEGQNLEQKLDSGWAPTAAEALLIAEQVLQILMYTHKFNPPIVHRDIKPSNIMINAENEVFVIDFGGALKQLEAQGSGGSTVIGKSGYIAPEEFRGQASTASDLYALGATLLRLLSGQEPDTLLYTRPQITGQQGKEWGLSPAQGRWLNQMIVPHSSERFTQAVKALVALDRVRGLDPLKRKIIQPHKGGRPIQTALNTLVYEERQALAEGSVLQGRYQIQVLLGSGSQSRVYRANDLESQRKVVLKELRISELHNVKFMALFEREVKALKRLEHPRIPAFYDYFEYADGGQLSLFLVTELIQGQTLSQLMETGWRPLSNEIWRILEDLLEILDYLHSQNPVLIHRDIKPSNIVLDEQQRAHLIDFGAVKSPSLSSGAGGSTVVYTVGYTAPEQLSAQGTAASDLYSLGMTLIHLLSGRNPFELQYENDGPQFEPWVNCPPFYSELLRALTRSAPAERLASAAEALKLLKAQQAQQTNARQWLKERQKATEQEQTLPLQVPRFHPTQNALQWKQKSTELRVGLSSFPPIVATLEPPEFLYPNMAGMDWQQALQEHWTHLLAIYNKQRPYVHNHGFFFLWGALSFVSIIIFPNYAHLALLSYALSVFASELNVFKSKFDSDWIRIRFLEALNKAVESSSHADRHSFFSEMKKYYSGEHKPPLFKGMYLRKNNLIVLNFKDEEHDYPLHELNEIELISLKLSPYWEALMSTEIEMRPCLLAICDSEISRDDIDEFTVLSDDIPQLTRYYLCFLTERDQIQLQNYLKYVLARIQTARDENAA